MAKFLYQYQETPKKSSHLNFARGYKLNLIVKKEMVIKK